MDRETNEIGSFFVVAGNFHYDRKKKFQSSVWRVCRFLVLVGNLQFFHYDRKKKVPVVCLVGVSVFGSGGIKINTNPLVQLQYIRYI